MSFRDTLKAKLGPQRYAHIEKEAQTEFSRALEMPLKDKFDTDQYYSPRPLLKEFASEAEFLDKVGLKVLPAEVVHIVFRCKLLLAINNEQEFNQRSGLVSLFANRAIFPIWTDKGMKFDQLEDKYVSGLETDIRERTLLSHISSLNPDQLKPGSQQAFFEDLFSSLSVPFISFLDEDLVKKHTQYEPGLRSYDSAEAREFFSAPSLGFKITGTNNYCFVRGSIWLRTFLNMLRIAAFIYPGQMEFDIGHQMEPPTFPVFLGAHAHGSFQWNEDKKESWEKLPDGCLSRSWGFRGVSNMWLDLRNCPSIKEFMLTHKTIFERLKNPWNESNANDVAPTLDILSSATQISDLGAKVLLIYCCLEHLFVPAEAGAENSKYIIGGLNALKPQLVPWFRERLYVQRNEYAHKGFVLRDDKTLGLIKESMKNVMSLLVAKLSASS
jgi:hypothetical protein